MVSFQCEGCGDVLTKKKLDAHRNRCGNSSFTCLDCMTQFFGNDYRSHTSCVSEAQKYHGATYKERKPKKMPSAAMPAAPSPPPPLQKRRPRQAYVSDVDETMSPTSHTIISPGFAHGQDGPINVFDFLVEDDSRPNTGSTATSPYLSSMRSGHETPASEVDMLPSAPSPPPASTSRPMSEAFKGVGYVYGDAPIETSTNRFDSDYDILLREPKYQNAGRNRHSYHGTQTPLASANSVLVETRRPGDSRSDKKRKRPVEELDLSLIRNGDRNGDGRKGVLHSGLTGGLSKLLSRKDSRVAEQSPVSPMKRTRHARRGERLLEQNGNGHHWQDDKGGRRKHDRQSSDESLNTHKKPKAIEGRKDLKAIEYYGASHALEKYQPRERSWDSNSEFFLSLIDKDHRSSRGQSIWGALKMFHEQAQGDLSDGEYRSSGAREQEEKRLLKGLRVKINRSGEIVLFARPASERDDA